MTSEAQNVFPLPYLTKPLMREHCNGCGLCCSLSLCEFAEQFLDNPIVPCPALEYEGGRTWCGLIRNPSKHLGLKFNADSVLKVEFKQLFDRSMGIGVGCGMGDFNDE